MSHSTLQVSIRQRNCIPGLGQVPGRKFTAEDVDLYNFEMQIMYSTIQYIIIAFCNFMEKLFRADMERRVGDKPVGRNDHNIPTPCDLMN